MNDYIETSSDTDELAWALLDANGDSVVIVDLAGTILFANQTSCQQYAQPITEILGASIWGFFPSTSVNHRKILFNQAIETGVPVTFNHRVNDGWKRTLMYPIQGTDNRVARIAICSRDITQQIDAEERLKLILLELITAQEDERHRISRDLHDSVGQWMTAFIFELRSVRDALANEQGVSADEIDMIIRNFQAILKNIRQIFYQLHPPSLGMMPLSSVLAAFCSSFEEANGVQVDFNSQEELPQLPDSHARVIYRFVQEGLTNVAKHAGATAAWVNLDYAEGEISVSLEDNGHGFDPNSVIEGIGLHGIRERFSLLNGMIEIESSLGKGARLSGTIPFTASSH